MEIVPAMPERWGDLADLLTRRWPRGGMQMTAGWYLRDAFAHGAAAIEAYPHVRGDSMGVPSTFERLGFPAVRRAGPRTIVRLTA